MSKFTIHIFSFILASGILFTACKKEQNDAVPVIAFNLPGITGDSLFINLTADEDFTVLPIRYSVQSASEIHSLFYMRKNVSKPVPEAVGKMELSIEIIDTLTPGIYNYRAEVKSVNSMTQAANLVIVVKGVDPIPIFDPATYPADFMTNDMAIVTINGVQYMRFVFSGWGSQIKIPPFTIDTVSKTSYQYSVKYALGPESLAAGLVPAKTYVNVNFGDELNRVPASWDPNELVPSEIESNFSQGYLDHNFREITGTLLSDKVRTISFIKTFSMETVNWDATKGDTLWISKIVPFRPQ